MEFIKLAAASLLSIVALFVIAKLMGRKQISQLDFFDYITGITVGSVAAELATELEAPWKPLTSMVIYGIVSVMLSVAANKMPRLRKLVNGSPTVIMSNGKFYRQNMKKAKLDLSEFLVMCRQEGYFHIDDIQTAIFEYNGRLTILPVSNQHPLTASDMNMMLAPDEVDTEVIMDGRILEENLKKIELDSEWLKGLLENQGYTDTKEICLGICDKERNLHLYGMAR